MSARVVVTDFRPLPLAPPRPQAEVLAYFAWVIAAYQCREAGVQDAAEAERLFARARAAVNEYGVRPEHVRGRQLVALPDPLRGPDGAPRLPDGFSFEGDARGPDLGGRMRRFVALASRVFDRAYEGGATPPSTVVHVSCAGYVSPSPAQQAVARRGWHDTGVTHSYHMGCYGAFPALKMARGFLADPHQTRVDVVHTEVLSLHADYTGLVPGTIVNMTLFGDGFVRWSALREADLGGRPGFAVLGLHEAILPDTEADMSWTPTGHLFEMFLSKDVPVRIKEAARGFVTELCRRAGLDFARDGADLLWAIHPGGPKIVDHLVEELGIEPGRVRWSREVLAELGNMSSATVPHVLGRMLDDDAVRPGQRVVAMAFGPGLTATGAVLERV